MGCLSFREAEPRATPSLLLPFKMYSSRGISGILWVILAIAYLVESESREIYLEGGIADTLL